MTRNLISMSPFRCCMWALHDRLETSVSEASCKQEIESIVRHGQMVPVLGRQLKGNPDYDVELIYGARRLFVARHLGKDIVVELCELSDRDAIVAMDVENRLRIDISSYERGMSYARWLRKGHFQSQEDIARSLQVSPSQVSRLLKLARLPSVVIDAFSNPQEIREAWGLDIMAALDDPQRRTDTLQRARTIASQYPRPPGEEVHRQLLTAAVGVKRAPKRNHDRVVKDASGSPVFRIRHLRNTVALLVPSEKVSEAILSTLAVEVLRVLRDCHITKQTHRRGDALSGGGGEVRADGPPT